MTFRRQIPDGFRDLAVQHSNGELQDIFEASQDLVTNWLNTLSDADKVIRRGCMSRRGGRASDRSLKPEQRAAAFDARLAEREATIEAARRRLGDRDIKAVIAEAERHRKMAAKPDPYAGLTGFERQLAIAADRGISERPRMPRHDGEFSLTGSQMMMFHRG